MAKHNFTSCLYNPNMTTFVTKICKGIPDFRRFKKTNEDHEKIFKWVVYTYDRQSPLVKEIPELMARKAESAILAGFTTDEDGRFDEEVENLLFGKLPEVNNLIVSYIARFADPHYNMLVASWNLQLDATREVLSSKRSKDTYSTLKQITADIEEMTRTVFSSSDADDALELRKALYSRVESDRLKLNPENVIKYLDEHGKLPKGFSPYGEEYTVDKLKFIGDGTEVDS